MVSTEQQHEHSKQHTPTRRTAPQTVVSSDDRELACNACRQARERGFFPLPLARFRPQAGKGKGRRKRKGKRRGKGKGEGRRKGPWLDARRWL